MSKETVIDSAGFFITSARDETVEGFHSTGNMKIEFLPENIAEKFPNLIALWAGGAIKSISKRNFRNLRKLRGLSLESNFFDVIDSRTFEDLVALEKLYLGEVKLFLRELHMLSRARQYKSHF